MSAAVMPMRKVVSAAAACGNPAASAIASIAAVAIFFGFSLRICSNPFSTSGD
jgi:hypothetical protein